MAKKNTIANIPDNIKQELERKKREIRMESRSKIKEIEKEVVNRNTTNRNALLDLRKQFEEKLNAAKNDMKQLELYFKLDWQSIYNIEVKIMQLTDSLRIIDNLYKRNFE